MVSSGTRNGARRGGTAFFPMDRIVRSGSSVRPRVCSVCPMPDVRSAARRGGENESGKRGGNWRCRPVSRIFRFGCFGRVPSTVCRFGVGGSKMSGTRCGEGGGFGWLRLSVVRRARSSSGTRKKRGSVRRTDAGVRGRMGGWQTETFVFIIRGGRLLSTDCAVPDALRVERCVFRRYVPSVDGLPVRGRELKRSPTFLGGRRCRRRVPAQGSVL